MKKNLKVFLTVLACVIEIKCQAINDYGNSRDQINYPENSYRPTRLNSDYQNYRNSEDNPAKNIIYPPNINLEPPYYRVRVGMNERPSDVAAVPLKNNDDSLNGDNSKRKEQSFALMNFGLNMISEISYANPGDGVIVSPLSIAGLLGVLLQGAVGSTKLEISKVLNMQAEDAEQIFKRVLDIYKKRSSYNILESASNIFLSQSFELEKKFKNSAINNFGSEITQVNFGSPSGAARQINNWVASKTRNRIREIVNPSLIDQNTDIVLVNALYFKGIWQKKFNVNATVPRAFFLASGETKMTPFMRTRNVFKTAYDARSRSDIIAMPFEGEDYSLLIALPSKNSSLDFTLDTFVKSLLVDYKFQLKTEEIDLQLPKFTIKSTFDLKPILQKFNLVETFSDASDLSGIGTFRNSAPAISSAVHSAVLSIDEDGATAAAATAFAAIALINDEIPLIKVDRPFLVVVWDNILSIPLFVGRIEDPTL